MFFTQKILNWFHFNGRKTLPWQKKNIYLVWISEIMLQQTQVNTVVPYFKKFKRKFPTILSLFKANINEILHLWSGLGLYRRAHNIFKTALIIKNRYNGIFPNNYYEIKKLPGIGKSTAHAILSFSYNFGYAVLDGNVKRILIRYHFINTTNKTISQLDKLLWKLIDRYLSIHHSNKFNQAMMDIGSLICIKNSPKCIICPLKNSCRYHQQQISIPYKNKKTKKKEIGILLSIIQYKNFVILEKQNNTSVWQGLFYFPITCFKPHQDHWKNIKNKNIPIKIYPYIHYIGNTKLNIITHTIHIKKKIIHKNKIWYNMNSDTKIGIPAPIKKIIALLNDTVMEKNMKKKKRVIFCSFLNKTEEGLDYPFLPGKIGQKIYQEISKTAWNCWIERQTKIINEKKLNMFLDKDRVLLEKKMKEFLFSKKK
ncbi:oxidative damage protection protein [Buchnera aphidicola]|uniref:oxidative damage protection protein n=1 Tax=Buchnera aphidicola TaxID=9 RepID=UPI00094C26FA|nr:oxidative damage protection protein [Buchnera aphidicola]